MEPLMDRSEWSRNGDKTKGGRVKKWWHFRQLINFSVSADKVARVRQNKEYGNYRLTTNWEKMNAWKLHLESIFHAHLWSPSITSFSLTRFLPYHCGTIVTILYVNKNVQIQIASFGGHFVVFQRDITTWRAQFIHTDVLKSPLWDHFTLCCVLSFDTD